MKLGELSKEALLTRLQSIVSSRRALDANLLAHLVEVEKRGLFLEESCPSLYRFCKDRLGMSEDEAFRRASATRIAMAYPVVLGMVARGELHLTNLLLVREHLTPENHLELLAAACGKTKMELQVFLVALRPRPDVPSSVTPIADPPPPTSAGDSALFSAAPAQPPHAPARSRVEPLAPRRFRIEFTVDAEVRDKLERARELMGHSNPSGDLAKIFDASLDLLLRSLEKKVLAKSDRPRRSAGRRSRRGYVSHATRRAVFDCDGWQCTFTDEQGRRCCARRLLQLDHIVPKANGGADDAPNLRVRCRPHNLHAAAKVFGGAFVARKIAERRARRGRVPKDVASSAPAVVPAAQAPRRSAVEVETVPIAAANQRDEVVAAVLGAAVLGTEGGVVPGAVAPRQRGVEIDAQPDAAAPRQRDDLIVAVGLPAAVGDASPCLCGVVNGVEVGAGAVRAVREARSAVGRASDVANVALSALTKLGFRNADAKRALDVVKQRTRDAAPPIEVVLREALRVLS